MERFFQFCKRHGLYVPEEKGIEFTPVTVNRKDPLDNSVKTLKDALKEGAIYPDDAVYQIITTSGRRGMSYNRIRRLAHEIGISFTDIPDVLQILFCRGQIL